jgi:hypothetical protein
MLTLTQNARDTYSSDLPQTILKTPSLDSSSRCTSLELGHSKRATTVDLRPIELPVKGVARDIVVKFASERQEWEEAFKIVAANYRARGYEVASTKPLRFTPYHALPDTITLVAKHAGHVLATFSIVLDNTMLGLPMESIYGEEITRLRGEGRRLLETTSLADAGLSIREFMQVFVTLIRLGMQYHTSQGGDTFAITVNPRHKSFYEKILGFQPMGERRSYATVQDAPAEALWLDRKLLKERAPRMYDEIFGEPIPAAALVPHRLSRDLIRQFDRQSSPGNPEKIESVFNFVDHFGSPRRW